MTMREPSVIDAPAPWRLQGRGYVSLLRCPADLLDGHSFVPESLRGKRSRAPYALMMFVDYASSPVGPYHELLFIPGSFAFEDGRRHLSISRIFVSTLDSVVNGQRNWGIPKDVAQFEVRYGDHGLDRVRVSRNGTCFAELAYTSWPLSLPVATALLPASWHTLAQHDRGQTFIYRPSARGWMRPARLVERRFDAFEFPDVASADVLATVKLTHFDMTFPASQILPHASARGT
ncbi:acetoacetate decarboxylase family protein [Fontimonas sp. SYSU GA230001]|uniref:acetoacetate decarboxylase family protein n=1 Tax=Fontimonas sp. SYSU GA230001 TaxID=3142450 RepID=UPI0032B3EDDF